MTAAIVRTELRLMLRNRLVASIAIGLPLVMGAALATGAVGPEPGADGWGPIVTLQVLFLLLFGVYCTATTTFATRRATLVLKRLRTSEASDRTIVAALLAPAIAVTIAQALAVLAVTLAAGAPVPDRPWLLAPAIALGALMCAGAAVATTRITSNAEMAQITTMPFFFATIAGAVVVLAIDRGEVPVAVLMLPGAAIAELCRMAWTDGPGELLPALLMLVLWVGLAAELAWRGLRWEPRS